MYDNLRAEIKRKNLTQSDVAGSIGITEATFSRKINGYYDFGISECIGIKKLLATKLTVEELFKKN